VEIGRRRGKLSALLDAARKFAGRRRGLTAATAFGLFVGICVAQTNRSLSGCLEQHYIHSRRSDQPATKRAAFPSVWHVSGDRTLSARECRLSGNSPVCLYPKCASDRVGVGNRKCDLPGAGATIMAVAIMVSTFGCNNGLILAGARAYYAMARDGLFFRSVAELNKFRVPAWGL